VGGSLPEVLAEVAGGLAGGSDVVEGLQVLVERAAAHAPGSDTWLLVGRAPTQRLFATSSVAEAGHRVSGEAGPCHEAVVTAAEVTAASTAELAARWPDTARILVGLGFDALHVIPLSASGECAGSLLYARRGAPALRADELATARAFAAVASLGLTLQRTGALAVQLQHALDARVVVEQAKGVVSASLRVTVPDALRILRGHARHRNLRLTDLAARVVAGEVRPTDLAA
jgi:hypothetical protein